MSKVCASSQEYPHVEKIKNVHEHNFQGRGKQQAIDNWIVREIHQLLEWLKLSVQETNSSDVRMARAKKKEQFFLEAVTFHEQSLRFCSLFTFA